MLQRTLTHSFVLYCFIITIIAFFTQLLFWTLHNYVHLAGVGLQADFRL